MPATTPEQAQKLEAQLKEAIAGLGEAPDVAKKRDLAKKLHFMASYLTDLKQQYAGESNHLGMVHEVLDSFLHPKKS